MRRHASASVVSLPAIVGSVAVLALSGVFVLVVVACGSSTSGSHRTNIDATLRQGLRDQAAGKLGTARKEYEDVLAKDKSNKYARYDLGLIAQTQGNDKVAARYYRLALDTDPRFQPALFNLAIVLTDAGSIDEAISLYRQVISLEPSNAGAHLNLGLLYLQNHRVGTARAELHKAITLNPSLRIRLPQSVPSSKNSSAPTTVRP